MSKPHFRAARSDNLGRLWVRDGGAYKSPKAMQGPAFGLFCVRGAAGIRTRDGGFAI